MDRSIPQNVAALLTGLLMAAAMAAALNMATQSTRRGLVEERGAAKAAILAHAMRIGLSTPSLAGFAERPLDQDGAQALSDAFIDANTGPGGKPVAKMLGVAQWRAGDKSPEVAAAFESSARNTAFRGAAELAAAWLEAYLAAPAPSVKTPAPSSVADLAMRRSAQVIAEETAVKEAGPRSARTVPAPDPIPHDAPTFWMVWTDAAGETRTAARFIININALSASETASPLQFSVVRHGSDLGVESPGLTLLPGPISTLHPVVVGDGEMYVKATEAPEATATPWHSHLIPALLLGALVGLAQFALMRSERRRADRSIRKTDSANRAMAAKQRELEASEARFKRLAESTNVVPWAANLDTQRFIYVGPQVEDFTGYAAATWYAAGFWSHHIHPEDRRRVLFDEIGTLPHGAYRTVEYRIRASNGRILHMRNMLTVSRKTDSKSGRSAVIAEGFLLDVTDMKLAEVALEESRRRAEEANKVKSEFLATMSHELRTPLNAVIGFSEIMKDEVFGPIDPQYREYSESIHTSGRHLLDLINDVLDLSKIEAGRIELAEAETDIPELVGTCVRLLSERMQSAGLQCKVTVQKNLPTMMLDERRVKQVLLNLMSNAVKFTPPGGAISISASRAAQGGIEMSVRDTGVGMSAEEIPRALSKFGQIDGELTRQHDGTGLGLPIAKSLMEMHGGAFTIESEKGKGTEIRLWLPPERFASHAA